MDVYSPEPEADICGSHLRQRPAVRHFSGGRETCRKQTPSLEGSTVSKVEENDVSNPSNRCATPSSSLPCSSSIRAFSSKASRSKPQEVSKPRVRRFRASILCAKNGNLALTAVSWCTNTVGVVTDSVWVSKATLSVWRWMSRLQTDRVLTYAGVVGLDPNQANKCTFPYDRTIRLSSEQSLLLLGWW